MADSWTAPTFLDDLVTLAEADATIAAFDPAVTVYDYWPSPQESLTDALILGYRVRDDSEWAALAQRRADTKVMVECAIECTRPGAGRTVARAARDRVKDVLQRVHELVRDTPPTAGEQTISALIIERDMQQYPVAIGDASTPGRTCAIEFVIEYTARTR